jgi:peptide/nickel transport system permease protein
MIAALLVSSFVIFSAASAAPGSPLAAFSGGRGLDERAQADLIARFHLDDPFLVRYVKWLGGVVRGDFGFSIAQRIDVSELIAARIGVTIQLVLCAAVIVIVVGVGMGILAAVRRGAADVGVTVASAIMAAVPNFVAAMLLTIAFVTHLAWFPAIGEGDGLWGRVEHLTLPAVSLALGAIAIVSRVTRAAVREELHREHVQTAVSRGIPRGAVLRRHVIRNAAVPIVTVTGLTTASLLAVSAVIERAFGLNGLGSLLVKSAATKDIAVVQGISLVIVFAFVAVNAIIDVLYLLLDPRIRARESTS